ncbi:lytic transglycosylase domain-containing protein [Spirillospora sp. NBC_00431]
MYGDHQGSPRRDDRQNFDSGEPWTPAAPPAPAPQVPIQATGAFTAPPAEPGPLAAPHEDDVKVAGGAQAAGPAGDTLGFQAVAPEPLRTGVSAGEARDEIASGGPGGGAGPGGPGRGGAGRGGAGRGGAGGGAGRRNGMRIVAVAAGAAVVIGGGAAVALALTGGSGGDDATVKPTKQLADAAPKVDPKVLEEQRRKLALERASRAAREDGVKAPSLYPKGKPVPTKKPDKGGGGGGGPSGDPVPAGEAQSIAKKLMPSFGFTGSGQFGCLVKLWNKESHWNVHADNPSSEAYGIPQANPGSKMSSAGPDWQNNATTQIKWGLGYIKGRYNTPCGAWSHSQSVGWY